MTSYTPTVHQMNFVVQPALEESDIAVLFSAVRSSFRFLSNYEYRKDEREHFVNNGPSVESTDEVYFKVADGQQVTIASGKDRASDILLDIAATILTLDKTPLTPFRITGYDFMLIYGIPYKGNHYEVIKKCIYRPDTVGQFYNAVSEAGVGALVRDNDIHLLLSLSGNRVLALRVNGRTTRSEIELGEYEEEDIQLRFGIQQQKVSELTTDLLEGVRQHVRQTTALCANTALGNILDCIILCAAEDKR